MLSLDQIKKSKQKGFTLIELVIVLAIAALILVIVFLAIGGAQRSQRDNASKDAAGKVIAAYASYLGDHDNTAPANVTDLGTYLTNVKDGHGNPPADGTDGAKADADTKFLVLPSAKCNAAKDATVGVSNAGTLVAVVYYSDQKQGSVCVSN